MADFLFRGSLTDLDPPLDELLELEAERQYRKLILIPSESQAPLAVRQILASAFQNIYAEGYPDEETRWMSEAELLDYAARLAHYRRYSDPRYYKGVEYADIAEALARRRCAETFAANGIQADDLFVNVQPLSGAPANNAVYHALVEPGETIMGMNLLHGGHLTHGSPVNRSGKLYKAVHYTVDPQTEQIDYQAVAELARQHRPKFIIAGYSSYPWAVDWERFRAIADEAGALVRGVDVQHPGQHRGLLRHDPDGPAMKAGEAHQQVGGEVAVHLQELTMVDDAPDDLAHVVGLGRLLGNQSVQGIVHA